MSKDGKKDWHKFKDEHQKDEDILEGADEQEGKPEPALDHPSYANLEEQLTLSEQKAHESWEKSVRALAELENVRRRSEREVSNAHLYGQEKLVSALLPVIDSLEQALQTAANEASPAMHEGLELTMKLFQDVLHKNGAEQIDPMGEAFDPQKHEAMTMQESAEHPANTVIAVFQKGYTLNSRLIRPARVIVSKGV